MQEPVSRRKWHVEPTSPEAPYPCTRGDGRQRRSRRIAGAVFGPFFGLLLLIPLLRRYRRRPWWRWVRVLVTLIGLTLLVTGQGRPGMLAPGLVLLLLAVLWGPLEDPDRMRQLARHLGASHAVNGGYYVGGTLDLVPGTALQFFLSKEELQVVATERHNIGPFQLAAMEAIQVDGQNCRPQNVSFAKAPPKRDEHPDHSARCHLTLRFTSPPAWVEIEYCGVFSRHLAEVAARTLHECSAVQRDRWPGLRIFQRL